MSVQIDGSQGKVIATSGDYSGGVSIGGTLTYEDVTNIDAVGLITARSGIEIGASPGVGASISVDGNAILSGITTFKGTSNFGEHLLVDSGYLKLTSEGDGAQIRCGAAQDLQLEHDGSNTYIKNTTGDLVLQNDDNIKFTYATGGATKAIIGVGGSVGIGLESPNSMLHVQGAEGRAQLTLGNTNAAASDGDFLAGIDFHIKDNNDATGSVCSAIRTYADQNHTASAKGTAIAFHTTDDDTVVLDERVRIDHYGALLVGTTTPFWASGDMRHEIRKDNSRTYTSPLMTSHSHLFLHNSDTTDNAFTGLGFRAGSGDGSIGYVYRDSANNSDFVINTDGNSNGVERLRVYNNGAVLIGAHSNEAGGDARLSIDCEGLNIFDGVGDPANYGLIFCNDPTSNKANGIGFFNDSGSTCGGYIVHQDKGSGNIGDMIFGTSASSDTPVERMRITAAGFIGIDNNAPAYRLDISTTGAVGARIKQQTNNEGDDHALMICRHTAARSGQNGVDFLFQNNSGTAVGKIDHGQSTTQYRTSSDYRLKENAVAILDGITRLKTLKPYRFNFISEPDKTVDGFFAHEVTAVPEAISGTKDQVDSDNNPIHQAMDYAKITPLLTAALQEAISKIEVLESEVAALKSS